MCRHHGMTRRTFIQDLGKGVLGISVGTVLLGACGSDGDSGTSANATTGAIEVAPDSTTTVAPAVSASSSTSAPQSDPTGLDTRQIVLGSVSAYVLVRGTEAAVVDTGGSGSAPAIEQGLVEAGLSWSDVGNVILTHRHPDHVGSLGAVADAAAAAVLSAGAGDIPAISAPRPVEPLDDGQQIFGLDVVATPGHTPGHVAVFDPGTATLIAGDSINGEDSGVELIVDGVGAPNSAFTPDMDSAIESVRRLVALEPDAIFFGHGIPKIGGAATALAALSDQL